MRLGLGSQSVQINSGRSWRLLDALGVFWRVLEASGGSWRLLDCLLEAPGGSWRLLAPRASRSSNLDSQGVQIQFWRLLEASGGFWRGYWRLLADPGDSWRLLETPGSSQAGGPLDLFAKHLWGANAITFPRHIPKQVILKDYKKMEKKTFKLKLSLPHKKSARHMGWVEVLRG